MSRTHNNPSICCLMLTMPHEVGVAIRALDSLLFSEHERLCVLVLVNGGTSRQLLDHTAHLTRVQVFESAQNLGVAGGRAFLADQDGAREADIIALIDNDLLVTTDYLEPFCELLTKNHEAGVVGASVLNYQLFSLSSLATKNVQTGPLGEDLPRLSNSEVRRYAESNISVEMFSHIGVNHDWLNAYFPKLSFKTELMRRAGRIEPDQEVLLSRSAQMRQHYQPGGVALIEVSNIAGCTQVFRRKLYDELGGIRPEFSPYGYEDADFCIRAMRAGYRNYTLTNAFSLHGTDGRHNQRQTLIGIWPARRNSAKSYAILANYHCPPTRRMVLPLNTVIHHAVDIVAMFARLARDLTGNLLRAGAGLSGYIQARLILFSGRR